VENGQKTEVPCVSRADCAGPQPHWMNARNRLSGPRGCVESLFHVCISARVNHVVHYFRRAYSANFFLTHLCFPSFSTAALILFLSLIHCVSLFHSLSLSSHRNFHDCPCKQDKVTYSRTTQSYRHAETYGQPHTHTHVINMKNGRLGASRDKTHQEHNNNQSRRTLVFPDRQFSPIS